MSTTAAPFPAYTFQPLGPTHDRAAFSCGNDALDDFIRTKARKERDLDYCTAFVMSFDSSPSEIAGYYTLSSHSIELTGIEEGSRRRLPRYPEIPVTLIGRMARNLIYKGIGVGPILLIDALKKACDSADIVGSYAVVVDAIDEKAELFYRASDFIPVLGRNRRFYLPMATIRRLGL